MKPKYTILYIFHVSHLGGGSLCLLNIVKSLDRVRFEPVVLLKTWAPLCEEFKKIGVTVIIEPSLSTVPYNRSIFSINSLKQIISVFLSVYKVKYWIKKTNADIVHLNTMMMYHYAIPGYKLKKKVIVHVREHWPKGQNVFQFNLARTIIKKYSDSIIAINQTSSDVINLPHMTEIIYDWISFKDREEFYDLKNIIDKKYQNFKYFLFLGGIQKIKGTYEIVTTFNEKFNNKNALLIIVGCDSEDIIFKGVKGRIKKILHFFNYFTYSDKIKKIIQRNDKIICIPATNRVKSLIEQAYCTIAYPTIPHAILPIAESIYLGKPVISANTPEAQEYSNNGEAAKLFEINNKRKFIEALEYSFENQEKMEADAKNGMDEIRHKFSAKKNINKLNNHYIKLVNNV